MTAGGLFGLFQKFEKFWRHFREKTTGPQCLSAVMGFFMTGVNHWLQMFIVSYLVGSTLCLHAHTEPMKTGGRNSRVSHEGGFFSQQKSIQREGNTAVHWEAYKESSDALAKKTLFTIVAGAFGSRWSALPPAANEPRTHHTDVMWTTKSSGIMVPAQAGWFIQELPSFLVPVLLLLTQKVCRG